MRGSDLEEGESQGLPVWSRHVGDPILASNRTRRVDFALFMVAALENDEARIRSAAATAFDAREIHRSGALREWLITTSVPFVGQSLTYGNIAEEGAVLIQLLRGALPEAE